MIIIHDYHLSVVSSLLFVDGHGCKRKDAQDQNDLYIFSGEQTHFNLNIIQLSEISWIFMNYHPILSSMFEVPNQDIFTKFTIAAIAMFW